MKISFFRVLLLVFLYFLCLLSKVSSEDIQCSFVGFSRNPGISGSLTITPNNITGEIKNLPIGNHSIVFHQYGDLSDFEYGMTTGSIFNDFCTNPMNIYSSFNFGGGSISNIIFPFSGKISDIIGRSIVIYENPIPSPCSKFSYLGNLLGACIVSTSESNVTTGTKICGHYGTNSILYQKNSDRTFSLGSAPSNIVSLFVGGNITENNFFCVVGLMDETEFKSKTDQITGQTTSSEQTTATQTTTGEQSTGQTTSSEQTTATQTTTGEQSTVTTLIVDVITNNSTDLIETTGATQLFDTSQDINKGAVIAGIVFASLILAILFFCFLRRRKKKGGLLLLFASKETTTHYNTPCGA